MFGKKKKEDNRFYVKSRETIPSLGRITILVDSETGVNYVHSWVGTGSGITPLFDADGNIVVEG